MKGWREEELTIWSGRNASGKSTFLNTIIIDLIKKEKTIIGSFEMPAKRYLRWMLMNITGQKYLDAAQVKAELKRIGENLFILDVVGECKPETVIDTFDYAARKYGVKNFVIDSLMKIAISEPHLLEKQKEFVNKLIGEIAKRHKGHVHLVAHPRKGFKDSDQPGKVDVSGSGDITNLADNVIIVWRPDEDYKEKQKAKNKEVADSVLIVKKNREWGLEGIVNFDFDSDTKKYTEWGAGETVSRMDYIHD